MAATQVIRVLLADEHDFVVTSLQIVFEMVNNVEMVGRAKDGSEAVEVAGELLPDVILMDLNMPVMDGLTATRLIREKYPQIKIIVLTASTLESDKEAALEAGAHVYLRKESSTDEIVEAIRTVVR
jgi:DNA-binding NarL/FixJ family response regulator